MTKIRIAHLLARFEPIGHARTVVDLVTRTDAAKYDFLIIAGRVPRPFKLDHPLQMEVLPELTRPLTFRSGLSVFLQLVRILRHWKPDIVHVHSLKLGLAGTLAARLGGVPSLVYSSYGIPKSPVKSRRFYEGGIFSRRWWSAKIPSFLSDMIVTVTPHGLEEELAMGFASRAKYRVIYNAIQPERFESTKHENAEVLKYRLGFDAFFPILGTAIRLDREKGLEFLLEAMAYLKNVFPDILLLVMGDGPMREHLIVLAKRLGLTEQVRFLGLRDDVPSLLRILDIFVLPSLYEAMGIVLAEAMALGKPVIATRVGGLPELIRDGEDGFLVPPGDAMRLAEKIARVGRDRELAKKVGDRAAHRARELFDMSKMMNDYEGLYQSLAQRKKHIS